VKDRVKRHKDWLASGRLQLLKTVARYKWRCMIGCLTKMIGPLGSEFSRRSDSERMISSWTVPQSHWPKAVQERAYIVYISNMQRTTIASFPDDGGR
jgi:hypothetical protein